MRYNATLCQSMKQNCSWSLSVTHPVGNISLFVRPDNTIPNALSAVFLNLCETAAR